MIELKVEPYCHNCPDFEPVTTTEERKSYSFIPEIRTWIKCKYEKRCRSIADHVISKYREEE